MNRLDDEKRRSVGCQGDAWQMGFGGGLERNVKCLDSCDRAVPITPSESLSQTDIQVAASGVRLPASRFIPRCAGLASSALWLVFAPASGMADPIYDRETNVAVRDRDHPEYDALGVTAGVLRIFPRVATALTFDDNIYAITAKTADFFVDLHPSVELRSLWSRNDLHLVLDYDAARYLSHPAQDTASYSGNLTGRLDVDRDASVTVDLSAARAIQPRISQNSIAGVLKPISYDLVKGDIVGLKVFDRIRASARFDVSHYSYDNTNDLNAVPVQEDYQDRDELVGTTHVDYAISPATAFFVEGAINSPSYRLRPPLAPFQRDSHGYDVLAGVDFAPTHLIGGTVGIGYESQSYDDHQFDGVSGLALRGALRWYATPLVTVTLRANRTFQDSGLPNVAAARFTEVSLAADYELLRNVILGGRLVRQVYQYPGINGRTDRYGGALDATYTLNRDVSIILAYTYLEQRSAGANSGLSFNDNRASLTVTFRR